MKQGDREEAGRALARRWLESLLARGERNEANGRPKRISVTQSLMAEYHSSRDTDFRRGVHQVVANDKIKTAIDVVWLKNYEGHDLKAVRLRSLPTLREQLGAIPLSVVAKAASEAAYLASMRGATAPDPQLLPVLDRMEHEWARGHSAYGLEPDDLQAVVFAMKTVAAILAGEHQGLDMRSFSVKLHGNSKLIEASRRYVERILAELFTREESGERFDLIEYLGLEKTPQPFFLGGCHQCRGTDSEMLLVKDYLGIPRHRMGGLQFDGIVRGFLIIENWTTFHKVACAVPHGWVVLFSSGFPSPGWVSAAFPLLAQFQDAPVLHWGDLDLGGFRIFEHLYIRLTDRLRPHRMSPDAYPPTAVASEPTVAELGELRRIAMRISALAPSVAAIERTRRFGIEQEAIPVNQELGLN